MPHPRREGLRTPQERRQTHFYGRGTPDNRPMGSPEAFYTPKQGDTEEDEEDEEQLAPGSDQEMEQFVQTFKERMNDNASENSSTGNSEEPTLQQEQTTEKMPELEEPGFTEDEILDMCTPTKE